MTATKRWAIGLVLTGTLLNSVAQIFYKFGANRLSLSFLSLITNYPLIIGVCIYSVSAILLLVAFRGGELSVLYPLIATSYIWVTFLAMYVFNEALSIYKLSGIAIIILGVSLIGLGSKR